MQVQTHQQVKYAAHKSSSAERACDIKTAVKSRKKITEQEIRVHKGR